MGLFGKKPTTTAVDVREMIQPIIDSYEQLSELMNEESAPNDFLDYALSGLTHFYLYEAIAALKGDEIYRLGVSGKISPPAFNAAMKSINLMSSSVDELMAEFTQTLVDWQIPYKKARELHKKAWLAAKLESPSGIKNLEVALEGKNKWDWINKESWV
jgi:hypothetical protein